MCLLLLDFLFTSLCTNIGNWLSDDFQLFGWLSDTLVYSNTVLRTTHMELNNIQTTHWKELIAIFAHPTISHGVPYVAWNAKACLKIVCVSSVLEDIRKNLIGISMNFIGTCVCVRTSGFHEVTPLSRSWNGGQGVPVKTNSIWRDTVWLSRTFTH